MKKFSYDYYQVTLERDIVIESGENAIRELGQIAINVAEEQTKLYCVPALWDAKLVDFDSATVTFKIRRKRNYVRR